MSAHPLSHTAEHAFVACLEGVDNPVTGKNSFLDVGTLAEFVICFPDDELLKPYGRMLSDHALRWLRTGLLENAFVNSSAYEYAIALLLSFATRAEGCRGEDRETLAGLVESGVVGRTELPLTWNAAVRAHFAIAGLDVLSAVPDPGEIADNLDKRVLRSKTDSYDLNALITVAQLASLGLLERRDMPNRFAHVLLVHAMRQEHINWLPLAALLGLDYYRIPLATVRAAKARSQALVGGRTSLLPGPPDSTKVDDRARISGQGVMIRSTLAHLCLLERAI